MGLDYPHIFKEGNIQSLTPQQIVNNESYLPGRVIRAASCTGPYTARPIIEIDGRLRTSRLPRLARMTCKPTMNGSWARQGISSLRWALPTSRICDSKCSLLRRWWISRASDGGSNPVKLKLNGSLLRNFRSVKAGWNFTRFDSYLVANPAVASNTTTILRRGNGGRVPSQTYHDAFVSWSPKFQQRGFDWLNDTRFQFGIQNVFNTAPPIDITGSERLYSFLGDPRMRTYAFTVEKHFGAAK